LNNSVKHCPILYLVLNITNKLT